MYEDEFNANEAVNEIIEDMAYVCDFKSDYRQWDDVGAASIKAFLENYDNSQLSDTVEYLLSYIQDVYENEKASHNKAIGIKTSLSIALREMYEYLELTGMEITPEDYDEYGDEIGYQDTEISNRMRCVRLNLEDVNDLVFDEERKDNVS